MKIVTDSVKSQKMTEIIWGLDWKRHLPCSLESFELALSSFEEFIHLKNSNSNFLITSDVSNDSFVKDIGSVSKAEYLKNVSDFFTIKKDGECVGVVVCEIEDWTTYYLRYIFIDPDFRSHNLTLLFISEVEKVLRLHSVDKITCDISPSHLRQVARMTEAGYVYTGNILSERFGAMMRLTKFLKEDAWAVYNKNFVQMFYTQYREGTTSSLKQVKEYV